MTLASCENFLNIIPDGQVKRNELLTTTSGIEDALYGVYAQMRQSSLYGAELSFSGIEVLAQNLDCYGSTSVTPLSNYEWQHSSVLSWAQGVWTAMYANISSVNSVLDADLIKATTTDTPENDILRVYKGEALALRAYMHFDLVRLFTPQYTLNTSANGIPYQTEFSLKTPDFESMTANYQHILADLHEAADLLKVESQHTADKTAFMRDRQTHLNHTAVLATLARVYLTMGNEEKAFLYADSVIRSGAFTLTPKTSVIHDVAGILSQKECIFGVYYSGFYSNVSPLLQLQTSYSSLDLRDDFMDIYNTEAAGLDYRTTAYFTAIETGGETHYRLSKLTDIYELNNNPEGRPSELIPGINLIRLPEMYYICAECKLQSDPALAAEYYNAVRAARGLDPLEQGRALTIDLINLERFKEFIGEGYQYYNLKRQNLSVLSADGSQTFDPTKKDIYKIPIPDSEYANRY